MQNTPTLKRLTEEQVAQYHRQGYLAGFPLFTPDELGPMQAEFERVLTLLPEDTNVNFVNWWHKKNRLLYDVCTNPRLLDYVEDILGPSFFLWGSQFFAKDPGDGRVVPWHQDAQYWPLSPQNSCTVFIAFWDCDRENACMRVVPGTHRVGILKHHTTEDGRHVLKQEIDTGEFDPNDAVDLELKAGQISLHDDAIVHGSSANLSNRRRVGFTMRFSTPDVKCDLNVWPTFRAFQVRGVDRFRHNPPGEIPTENGITTTIRP